MTIIKSLRRTLTVLALTLLIALVLARPSGAGGPVVWETNSRAELLNGEARGVSVTSTGALMLAPQFTQIFDTEQAYVWSSAADASGNVYLGTGHDGKIFRVTSEGRGSLLYDAAELDVTALAAGRDGALYAGTSPDGKVYRVGTDGRAEVFFDPPDKYIWSLAFLADGALAVGTGDSGKLYRVRAAGAKAEESLLVDINETHVISLLADGRGNLIAGTDPGGLVLRVSPDGKAFALFDAPLREIHSLALAQDGSIYALALGDAATGPRPAAPAAATSQQSSAGGGAVTGTVTTVDETTGQVTQFAAQGQPAARSRNELTNARSAVFRIMPDGGTDVLWSSTAVTGFAVAAAPQGGGALLGTSDKGRVYSITNDGRDTLLVQSGEDQVSTFVTRGRELLAASSNGGKLFRLGSESVREGS
ncbi:MAG TPA: WD40 repeat domain-containing protein, partial [Pyrinomonadaceae bacterium]|nr:WD40 repeat domain-containing protein [Pyrinomonadaceae bacterium]